MNILCSCYNHMVLTSGSDISKWVWTRHTIQNKILWLKKSDKPTRIKECMFCCIFNVTNSTVSLIVDLTAASNCHTTWLDHIRDQRFWWKAELPVGCWKKAINPHRPKNVRSLYRQRNIQHRELKCRSGGSVKLSHQMAWSESEIKVDFGDRMNFPVGCWKIYEIDIPNPRGSKNVYSAVSSTVTYSNESLIVDPAKASYCYTTWLDQIRDQSRSWWKDDLINECRFLYPQCNIQSVIVDLDVVKKRQTHTDLDCWPGRSVKASAWRYSVESLFR